MTGGKKKFGLALLACLVLCFIWGNSMLPGEESKAISGGLLNWLRQTFPALEALPELYLRKLGHFSEFCLLGFLLTWFFLIQGQRGIHRVTMPLLFALLTAVTDETIQTFSLERYPSVMDVWIDTAGACVGIVALLVLHSLITLLFKRKGTKT